MVASIYEFPDIFRRVHKEQPHEIGEEVRFLRKVWKRHARRPVRRVLDLACGNSPHGQILARAGLEVVGIDRSATMIAAGRRESRELDHIHFYRRPIERFKIPERRFDLAIFMSETFPVMTANAAILSHLESVAATLRKGGLYVIDIDRHDGFRVTGARKLWRERTITAGGATVRVRAHSRPAPWYSGIHSIFDLECELEFPGRSVTTRDLVPVRYTIPPTLDLLARASGKFEMIAAYADLSFTIPMQSCERRWWGVLRRT
ncbi:MAG: class I SAM-dependent methyltransferase [Candidatus Binataceae bacterium]